jgi:hypothetical protein
MLRNANNLSYRNVILSEAAYGGLPVAYWPMDEVNGAAAVDIIGGANATINGGVTLGSGGPIHREQSEGMTFNGSTGYTVANLAVAPPFTVEMWVKNLETNPGFTVGAGLIGADGMKWFMQIGAAPRWQFYFAVDSTDFSTGVWTHLVGQYLSGAPWTNRIYRQGVLTTSTNSSTNPGTTSQIFVARRSDGVSCEMIAAHVAIYNYIVAADRIRYHTLAGLNGVFGGK